MEALLDSQPDFKIVAQTGSLAEAGAQVAKFGFDLVVLFLGLPDGSGADLIADMRRANPQVRVLVLSANFDPAGIEKATSAGADEILDKITPMDEILGTARRLGSS